MRALPLSALRAFEAAARTGSFRAAAVSLSLTPSAVSHAIRGLERQIGAPLFARDGRSVRLTVEGETLMTHVERGFGELRHGLLSVSTRGPTLLRLHCAPSFAAQWLVPRLPQLLGRRGGLELRLAAGTDYTRFVADEFDADIVYGAPEPKSYGPRGHEGIIIMPLIEETVTPLCCPAMAPRITSVAALLDHPLIESDNKKIRWDAWFKANGMVAPAPHGPRFDRSFFSLSAAADGLGVALESTLLAERELLSGRLVRPLLGRCQDVTYIGHHLVFPRGLSQSRGLRLFLDWLLAELGLPGRPPP
jgi:LysR family glycine cleavage system transcriptional activator